MNIKTLLQKVKTFIPPFSKKSLILMVERELRKEGIGDKYIPQAILFGLLSSRERVNLSDAKKEVEFICSVLDISDEKKTKLIDEVVSHIKA